MNTNKKHFGLRSLILIGVIGLLLFGGVSITSVAAKSSIPGDMLYPVKTTVEQTRLSLAQDAGDRAQMKLSFAEERLREVGALIKEGRYREINAVVLAFEADINGAILELGTLAEVDPARAARLALDVTSALTRYAQTLSELAAVAPEAVRATVSRALDSTRTAGSLELPSDDNANDNANGNSNDNANMNDNDNANDNDNGNANDDDSNDNDDNSNANSNDNDDNSNANSNDDDDDDDDNGNANSNDNDDDDDDDQNGNANSNDDDDDDDHNSNSNDDDDDDDHNSNGNSNDDDDDDDDDDSNDNDDDDDDDSGKGSGKGDGDD